MCSVIATFSTHPFGFWGWGSKTNIVLTYVSLNSWNHNLAQSSQQVPLDSMPSGVYIQKIEWKLKARLSNGKRHGLLHPCLQPISLHTWNSSRRAGIKAVFQKRKRQALLRCYNQLLPVPTAVSNPGCWVKLHWKLRSAISQLWNYPHLSQLDPPLLCWKNRGKEGEGIIIPTL